MKHIIGMALVLGLTACGTPALVDDPVLDLGLDHDVIAEDLSSSPNCDSPSWEAAQASLETMEMTIGRVSGALEDHPENHLMPYEIEDDETVLAQGTPIVADANFLIADGYLKAGCLPQAKNQYQHVIATLTGSDWEAYRERAMMGITEVNRR